MKKLIFAFCLVLLAIAGKAAVDVPITYHRFDYIYDMVGKENVSGEYTFTTTGTDPYVYSDITSVTTADHSVYSFEYIAEEGIDAVQVFFSTPPSEENSIFIYNLVPTTTWEKVNINLKSNPNWESTPVQTTFRIDLGNISGKLIKIRNVVMKATQVTPISLNTSSINNLSATDVSGVYTLSTTGTDPYIFANNVDVRAEIQFILSLDYIADEGIDNFQFHFFANGESLSDDKSAIVINVPSSSVWKNLRINLKNSNGTWNKKAVQSNFRIDAGTLSGKTIQLKNIAIIDGADLLTTSFPIKLEAGSENDLTYTQPQTDTWSIASTGTNPYISTIGFSEMYDPSLVKYLTFEYKSTTGINNMDVYYYNPTNGFPVGGPDPGYVVSAEVPLPFATQWMDYLIDLSLSPNWKDAGSFRLGFGSDAGKDFTIRNIKLSDINNIFRTVFFETQSEITVDSITTNYGAIIPMPVAPMRLGYNLTGWFKEPECINEWNFASDKVTAKTTLYAKWVTVNTFTITFNSQGGSPVANLTTNANTGIAAPIPPTRTDFRFQGWFKEADCINKWNFATEKITSDTTFFAKWATSAFVDSGKHCLNWPQLSSTGTPAYLIDHWDYIETLPFDGVVIFPPQFQYQKIMTKDAKVTYKEIFTDSRLGELSQLFDKVRHNYIVAWCNKPGDFFDEKAYSLVAENFAVLAKAAKDAGIAGILFDDEQYIANPWDYPAAVDSSAKYTIEQYRVQARLQGKKVMQAILAEFPNIEVMFSHGPYWSEPKFNQLFLPNPVYADGELLGSFFLGFVEAATDAKAKGYSPKVIDGGEFYKPRSVKDFEDLYQFRKNYMPSAENNSATIPESLRPLWADNVSVASAVSNLANEAPMDPTIMFKTLERATRQCDHLVWFYSEVMDWYTPGAVSQDWVDAVKDGFAAGLLPRVLATSVTVTGADNLTTITTKGGTLQMSAIFTPGNTTDKIIYWTVTNGTGKAKIDQTGLLTASGDGTVTVKATARDGSGVVGQLVITISNQVITSVPESIAGNDAAISIYPNPLGKGILTIDFGKEVSGIVSFFDVNGKLLLTKNIENTESTQIESGMLPKGVLIVKAFVAGNMKVSKLIVE